VVLDGSTQRREGLVGSIGGPYNRAFSQPLRTDSDELA
jgi:hypothetical protein